MIAANLLDTSPIICQQNISELINVLLNNWKYPKQNLASIIEEILDNCQLVNTSSFIYKKAFYLSNKYNFQIFDAIIVATAIETGSKILFSEDMENGLIVEKQLTIKNPFI